MQLSPGLYDDPYTDTRHSFWYNGFKQHCEIITLPKQIITMCWFDIFRCSSLRLTRKKASSINTFVILRTMLMNCITTFRAVFTK